LKETAYPVKSRRISVATGIWPVFSSKWMIGDQRPSQARGLGLFYDFSEPFKQVIPVRVFLKKFPFLNSPVDNVGQSPRPVNS